MGAKFFYRDIDLVYFVNNKLISNNLINQKDRVLLSFSGGQDSICFVFILNQLYCQLELDITFFWCHHLWQTDSFYLMQQIAKLSFLFQFNSCFPIPLTCISSELLARKWRQSCSYRVCLFYNYSKICLAHTFNDKVENIFLNFIRGTGLIGLAPLRWIQLAKRISKPNIILNNFLFRNNTITSLPQRACCTNPSATHALTNRRFVRGIRGKVTAEFSSSYRKSESLTQQLCVRAKQRRACVAESFVIPNKKDISRHNYLNYLSSETNPLGKKLNGPNMCISQGNSDKLKNLTKKVIRKFVQKGKTQLWFATKARGVTNEYKAKGACTFQSTYDSSGAKQSFATDVVIKSNFCKTSGQNLFCNSNNISVKGKSLLSSSATHAKGLASLPKKSKVEKYLPLLCFAPKEKIAQLTPYVQSKEGHALLIPLRVKYKLEGLRIAELYLPLARTRSKKKGKLCYDSLLQHQLRKPFFALHVEEHLLQQHKDGSAANPLACVAEDLLYELLCVAKESDFCDLYNKPKGKQLLNGCFIVRPLLSISRIELNKICYFWELPIYPDKSNQKVKFLRNRVRGQLLPTIKLFFNLNIENIFLQLAKIVETEDYCLTQIVNEFTKNTDVYHTKMDIYSKIKK